MVEVVVFLASYVVTSMSYEFAAVMCVITAVTMLVCAIFREKLRSW